MSSNNATPKPEGGETGERRIGDMGNSEGRDARGRWVKDARSPDQRFGRPRGSRNKLAENFLADLSALWEEQGENVLRRAAFNEPMKFADMVARLLPAKIEIRNENLVDLAVANMSDERLADLLETLEAHIAEKKRAGDGAGGPLIDVTPLPAPPVVEPFDPFAEYEAQLAREAKQAEGGGDDGNA